jgi:hypothetical protein
LKPARETCHITYKGKAIRITEDFSIDTLKTMRPWNEVFQTLKENNCQPRLLYPEKLLFRVEEEMGTCHNKQKLKQFMTTKPTMQKIFKEGR